MDLNKTPFGPTRRLVLAAPLLLLMLSSCVTGARGQASLADDVAAYVGYGIHRAGTRGERRTADWLRRRLTVLGYDTRLDPFPVRTLLQAGAKLSLAGRDLAAFPQWLPPQSSLGVPVTAPLLPLDSDSQTPAIRFMTQPATNSPYWTVQQDALVDQAVARQARALVLAMGNASNGLYACNRNISAPAFPIPVALVAGRDLPAIVEASRTEDARATLRVDGEMTDTSSFNVIGQKPGKGRALVLSTPLTGWFHCGGERGPGIALWLRMAAVLARETRPVVLLGTGAHEIGQLGMAQALLKFAPPPEQTAFWIHFGASTAATKLDALYGVTSPQYLVATELTAPVVRDALLDLAPDFVIGSAKTAGEAGQVLGAGHQRFAGISGHFPAFHTPQDRGEAVDFAQLEKVAVAAAALIAQMSAAPD